MKVGVIQSSYLPWRGYFDFIASVDLFVVYDDVQYATGSWRNRNRLKTPMGLQWITVPVRVHLGQLIQDVEIARTTGVAWRERHRRQLTEALGRAPYFGLAMDVWEECAARNHERLTDLNVDLLSTLSERLAITTPTVRSSQYQVSGTKTDRLICLLETIGATTYLSGPTAKGYLDEASFRDAGIRLEYKTYDYPEYPQLWGPFEGAVTVLDLIANCGPRAKDYLRSCTPDEVAVP